MSASPTHYALFDESFKDILGPSPSLATIIEKHYAFAHEACIFLPETEELIVTSNRIFDPSGQQRVEISKIGLPRDLSKQATCDVLDLKSVDMANGGVNFSDTQFLLCSQGSMDSPSGIWIVSQCAPHKTSLLVSGFHSRAFNSVNDVVVHSDGSIWFTDPIYGYEQGYRPVPQLPNQVYRLEPYSCSIRVVADDFGRPNGICFSPDETVLYITDTDRIHGDGTVNDGRASTIYSYAMDVRTSSEGQFLTNRRVFAMAEVGIPDGIKCDLDGNVYSGCGDGVNVWLPSGKLIGKILVPGGVANFCFGRPGEMFLLNESRILRAQLAPSIRGALLKL